MRRLQISSIFFIVVVLSSVSFAGNVEDALQAANQGNYKKAHQLWLIEAEAGSAVAQLNLGLMSDNGFGVLQDEKQAVIWYRLAAEQGEQRAQYFLGTMYEKGRGVPTDFEESVRWYRLSAEQGYLNAQYKLGLMYLKGQGVAQNLVNAYAWWVVASSQGHEDAKKYMKSAQEQMAPDQIEKAQQVAKQIWAELDK
ncbi:MAG: tetratricopeptide repeat protein [Desulfuromonadales bacterium]